MRAYRMAMFLIVLQMSIIVVGALQTEGTALYPESFDENALDPFNNPVEALVNVESWDWEQLTILATGGLLLIGSLIFRLPVGAAVFAGTFAVMGTWASSILNMLETPPYYLMPEITSLISVALTFVFLFAFIQLASSSTGD